MADMLQDLIHSLQEMVEDAKPVPLGGDKCIVDREKMLYIINETIRFLPEDLEIARDIVAKRNTIINEAKEQSDDMIKKAQFQVQKMVSEQEIVFEATAEAREILLNAKTKSAEMKKVATDYCADALQRTEEGIASIFEDVKSTRRKFNSK